MLIPWNLTVLRQLTNSANTMCIFYILLMRPGCRVRHCILKTLRKSSSNFLAPWNVWPYIPYIPTCLFSFSSISVDMSVNFTCMRTRKQTQKLFHWCIRKCQLKITVGRKKLTGVLLGNSYIVGTESRRSKYYCFKCNLKKINNVTDWSSHSNVSD